MLLKLPTKNGSKECISNINNIAINNKIKIRKIIQYQTKMNAANGLES